MPIQDSEAPFQWPLQSTILQGFSIRLSQQLCLEF